ncbi:MAG TPA: N-6 DNA methylase [Candidatus Deferrimicrobium sp.]|nr:N-6 DNA methylase [Candidatus Deferrimicrobium sp.]
MAFIENLRDVINKYKDIDDFNRFLKKKAGLIDFLDSAQEFEEFKQFLHDFQFQQDKSRDMGDFQTPNHLTDKICEYLSNMQFNPEVIIEPTCGTGNFVISGLKYFSTLTYVYCIEIQKKYKWVFLINLLLLALEQKIHTNIEFHCDNIFTHQFSAEFQQFLDENSGQLLVLGNPPWITNTELSLLNSTNVPFKSNIKGDRGIEALTGKGNFDIAEFIILQMIQQFSNRKGKVAMLCKTSVTKNLVRDFKRLNLKASNFKLLLIDSQKVFNINAEAGFFVADLGISIDHSCIVSPLDNPDYPAKKFGWINDRFVSNIELYEKYNYIDGKSPFIWRHGIKHDALKVMVLTIKDKIMLNGLNEIVDIETDLLYPYIKSSDLKKRVIKNINRQVIITQTSLNQDTEFIASAYPRLWDYLMNHSDYLDKRKSAIYKNRTRFSIFGIGEYVFAPYKIAISGFYKEPHFSIIFPINTKPAIPDDTCYYLFFNTFENAFFTWVLLNMDPIKDFLSSIVFLNSKRPYTKEILMRIDLSKLIKSITYQNFIDFYETHLKQYLDYSFTKDHFALFLNSAF